MKDLIARHSLAPHPEGGHYRRTYEGPETNGRPLSTAIVFLLRRGEVSHLHRLDADELWHFYEGDALEVVELGPGGPKITRVDRDQPQYAVRAGTWFGAWLPDDSAYAFTGCTVAPGFMFDRFEMGTRAQLLASFPACHAAIARLT